MAEQSLFNAVKDGNLVQVKELLSQGVNANAVWPKGMRLGKRGSAAEQSAAVQRRYLGYLAAGGVQHWGDVEDYYFFESGFTPLHVAAEEGDASIVEALLACKADLTIRNTETHGQGKMPLHRAIQHGHMEVVKLCLSRQTLPDDDGKGDQAILSEACTIWWDPQQCQMMMELLLAAGACINGRSKSGETALHRAARADNAVAVKWLLDHDADIAAKDHQDWTALHHAISCIDSSGGAQVVQILLAHGADSNLTFLDDGDDNEDNPYQGSLLYVAAKLGCARSVTALLAAGALPAYKRKNFYPLEVAVTAGNWNVVEVFLSHYKERPPAADDMSEGFHDVLAAVMNVGRADVVEQLLSLFVLPDPDSYDDYSYLMEELGDPARRHSNCWQVLSSLLVHCKGDWSFARGQWLRCAAASGSLQTIEVLLLHGVSVNLQRGAVSGGRSRDSVRMTALHEAAGSGNLSVVQKLLSCGADASTCAMCGGKKGSTALDLSTDDAVTKCLRDHMHALQGRPVPCHLVHWHVAQMQPPMVDNLDKLLAQFTSIGDQEGVVKQCAQELLKMQQVLVTDVASATETAASARKLDRELAELLQGCARQQHTVQACKVSLQSSASDASDTAQQLSADKQSAEQAVIDLLKQAKSMTQQKVELCEQRYQQRDKLSSSLASVLLGSCPGEDSAQVSIFNVEETVRSNDEQLAACRKLVLAFRATQDARIQLQKCLDQEQTLLQQLQGPVQESVAKSKQLIGATSMRLKNSDPAREKRHAEMLIRDVSKQLRDAQQLQQLKLTAQSAITEVGKQAELQRDLKRNLIRAKADLEVLLLDDKQSQAARVQVDIDNTTAELAALAGRIDAAAATVSAAAVHHPELHWEQAATALLPKLGMAKDLFDKSKKLRDFTVIVRHGPSVREVEDLGKQKWVIKGIDSGPNGAREAERLCKLRGHPLVVPLQSTFMDADRLYLQMPFYKNGNLRKWVESIKAAQQTNGTLSALEKAAVRTTMRQVAQAISYTHQQGIVHRDIKPENVLLQDNGNIALCDFGISKDIISSKYESTMALTPVGTAAYCAPEAGSDAWRLHASAVDAWSFGIMLLEVGAGNLYSWVAPLGKIAFQPGRLDAAVPLLRAAVPADDDWYQALWDLVLQLLDVKPQNRPSMSVALLSNFFTSDKLALGGNSTPTDRKFRTLNSHLDALRHSHTRLPAHLIQVQSEASALADMLTAFSAADLALHKAFNISWGEAGGRKPLQEAMDVVFSQLSHEQGAAALFQQCDEPVQVFRSFLPPASRSLSAEQTKQYTAFGRMMVKCLLEGIHVPLNLSAAMHCMLVHHETLSSHADTCIAMLANFDPAEAQRLRQLLAADHGDGDELMMSVGAVMGTDDDTMVTDTSKSEVVCRKVRQHLVEDRRPALEAIAQGFHSLDLADHLEHFSGVEMAALCCGEQYMDVDALIRCFEFDGLQQDTAETKQFLETFVRSLSESSIRVFLARVTNQLSLPRAGQQITVEVQADQEQPRLFPIACHMQLPGCRSYEVFANRMAVALRLGDYFSRTDAQQGHRLTQAEEQAVVAAMRGEIRAGGYYRCICGYIYTVGECGGPMERAACPRCGHAIGGQQHRLEGGNEHVAFDGAEEAAWPQ